MSATAMRQCVFGSGHKHAELCSDSPCRALASSDALCRQERNTMSSSTLIHKTKLAPADAMKVVAHFLHDMRPGAASRVGRILSFDAKQNRRRWRLPRPSTIPATGSRAVAC